MKVKIIKLVCFVLLVLIFSACQTFRPGKQQATDKDKQKVEESALEGPPSKKVGLFISAGGAQSFSALSALSALEQEGIYFEQLSGSGWGAWIAAFYSQSQKVSNLKWNLFKLKEQGVFDKKLFNKKKPAKLLRENLKDLSPTNYSAQFFCPSFTQSARLLWHKGQRDLDFLLKCLNLAPPLFFQFQEASTAQASFFSFRASLKQFQKKGIDIIVWIKPQFSLRNLEKENPITTLFWKELFFLLNQEQEHLVQSLLPTKLIVIKTHAPGKSLKDFSALREIFQSPLPYREKQKIKTLKHLISSP